MPFEGAGRRFWLQLVGHIRKSIKSANGGSGHSVEIKAAACLLCIATKPRHNLTHLTGLDHPQHAGMSKHEAYVLGDVQ